MNTTYSVNITTPEDMFRSQALNERFFSCCAALPVSFVLDEKAVRGIPREWRPVSKRRRIDANISETVFEGQDPGSGLNLRVECTQYKDYPVLEWVAWFTNNGHEPTPIIRDILAMDATLPGTSPVLYHCNGDIGLAEGYTPSETPLHAGTALDFAPNGGRPCDGAFPYYRIAFEDWGASMAIGWPAQWTAGFAGLSDGVSVRAGQEKTQLRLMPGESIRTPRMTVLSWSGDASRAVNLWRRWYLAHILPRPNGGPMKPLLACCCPDDGEEFTAATEENQTQLHREIQGARHSPRCLVDRCRVVSLLQQRPREALVDNRHVGTRSRKVSQWPEAGIRPRSPKRSRPVGLVRAGTSAGGHETRLRTPGVAAQDQ